MEKHNEKVRVEEAELLEKMASINGFSYEDNSNQIGFSISKNKVMLQTFCDVVYKELINKKTIALSGLGAFSIVRKEA